MSSLLYSLMSLKKNNNNDTSYVSPSHFQEQVNELVVKCFNNVSQIISSHIYEVTCPNFSNDNWEMGFLGKTGWRATHLPYL